MTHRVLIAPRFTKNTRRTPQKKGRRSDRGRGHQRTVDRNRTPWVLTTNSSEMSSKRVMAMYATRMQIEETFQDIKSVRFGWSFRHVRTHCAQRYAIMLLLAALAGFVLTLIDIAAEQKRIHLRFQTNTIRHRRVLSLFQLGEPIFNSPDPAKLSQLELKTAVQLIKASEIIH